MPPTHVALLRGINVGKAKRIAMADLRGVVAALGYTDVRTLLNSGNVVLTAPPSAKADPGPRIERAVRERLGVSSRVVVVTAREWKTILAGNPLALPGRNPSRLMVAVLEDAVDLIRCGPEHREDWKDAGAYRDALAWVAAGRNDWPFSFVALCEALGLDADSVRKRLLGARGVRLPGVMTGCRQSW